MLLIIFIVICFCAVFLIHFKLNIRVCKFSKHLMGKVVIVTGGNAGIGFETAVDLAARGARVILACRNEARGEAARTLVVQRSGNPDVEYRHLDLSSFTSVFTFAANILATEPKIDILINNAGIITSVQNKTEDGLEPIMQTNFFGPFLLTNLLLPVIKASAPSRIINLTSTANRAGSIAFLDPAQNNAQKYWSYLWLGDFKKYCDSKFCIALMTVEMSKRLKNTGVTVNCVHPGFVATNIIDRSKVFGLKHLKKYIKYTIASPWEGAQTSVYLAVSPEVSEVSGRYFSGCREQNMTKAAKDPDLALKLWKVTEKIVKL